MTKDWLVVGLEWTGRVSVSSFGLCTKKQARLYARSLCSDIYLITNDFDVAQAKAEEIRLLHATTGTPRR